MTIVIIDLIKLIINNILSTVPQGYPYQITIIAIIMIIIGVKIIMKLVFIKILDTFAPG